MTVTEATCERYKSTTLADVIKAQGRRKDWLAEKVGVSESFIGKVARGYRTINRTDAERVALVLGVPFFVLFELHKGDDYVTDVQQGDPA